MDINGNLKTLLLKDLCSRLPHGVIVDIKYNKEHGSSYRLRKCSEGYLVLDTDVLGLYIEEEIHLKPYLRPLSSMTEEELEELNCLCYHNILIQDNRICGYICGGELEDVIDWLYEHHFDFRGLILLELALEAPEGMYN